MNSKIELPDSSGRMTRLFRPLRWFAAPLTVSKIPRSVAKRLPFRIIRVEYQPFVSARREGREYLDELAERLWITLCNRWVTCIKPNARSDAPGAKYQANEK